MVPVVASFVDVALHCIETNHFKKRICSWWSFLTTSDDSSLDLFVVARKELTSSSEKEVLRI